MIIPTSPVPVFFALLLALATSKVLIWRFGAPKVQGRFVTIDGLRGYLAFLVFLHHSCIWYFYLRTSQFDSPPSNFMANIGRASVSMFFMITGFLFFTKIINEKKKGIDWIKLYVSRILRLTPLYLFAMLLLFVTVAVMSDFTLAQSPATLTESNHQKAEDPRHREGLLLFDTFAILYRQPCDSRSRNCCAACGAPRLAAAMSRRRA